MQLSDLKIKKKKAQRVGRGGKRGTTSGRGQKGQKSRSGHKMRPAIRDLISRLPKRRGYRNKIKGDKPVVVNLSELSAKLLPLVSGKNPVMVNMTTLKTLSLIPGRHRGQVKILGNGEAVGAFMLEGFQVSASVKAKIEKAGGSIKLPVTVLPSKHQKAKK